MKRTLLIFLLLTILCLPSIASLFHQGFFQTDDGEWMVIRFSAFYQSLRDGQFPVRFLGRLNYGYGYPVADFLYPGFMYLGVLIHLLGFNFVNTIKVILGLSLVFSSIAMYLWLSKLFGKVESIFGSLFYLYAPYHLFDVYKRGSVGEALALAIVPFIFWQIERESIVWASLGISFLVLSHNTLALLFLPVVIFYMALMLFVAKDTNRRRLMCKYSCMVLIGIGASSFFSIPAIFDLQYTIFQKTNVSNWDQYFSSFDLVGIPAAVVIVLTFGSFISGMAKISQNRLTVLFLFISLVSLFMSLSVSAFVWNVFPVSFIQFPFRFLSITIVSASFLIAFLLSLAPFYYKVWIGAVVVVIAGLLSMQYMVPNVFFDKGEGFYTTNMDTTTVKNEYMPIWVKKLPQEMADWKVQSHSATVSQISTKTNRVSFVAETLFPATAIISTVYFPGWEARVDGGKIKVYPNDTGLIEVPLSKGQHAVMLTFEETTIALFADMVSFFSLFALFWFVAKDYFPLSYFKKR